MYRGLVVGRLCAELPLVNGQVSKDPTNPRLRLPDGQVPVQ
jgi:hypothetical protein